LAFTAQTVRIGDDKPVRACIKDDIDDLLAFAHDDFTRKQWYRNTISLLVGNALTKLLLAVELLDRINFEILVNAAFQLSGRILTSEPLPHGFVLLGRSLVN